MKNPGHSILLWYKLPAVTVQQPPVEVLHRAEDLHTDRVVPADCEVEGSPATLVPAVDVTTPRLQQVSDCLLLAEPAGRHESSPAQLVSLLLVLLRLYWLPSHS